MTRIATDSLGNAVLPGRQTFRYSDCSSCPVPFMLVALSSVWTLFKLTCSELRLQWLFILSLEHNSITAHVRMGYMLRMIPCAKEWMWASGRTHVLQESFLISFYLARSFFCRLLVPLPHDPSSQDLRISTLLLQLHLWGQKVEWDSLGYVFCFELDLEVWKAI